MARDLVILGSGGSLSDVLDIVEALEPRGISWRVLGLLDDGRPAGATVCGRPVLGPLSQASQMESASFINTIGSDRSFRNRRALIGRLALGPERFATLVHPAATVSARARLGRGVYVAAGASVGGGVTVADHATLHPGCVIGHDTTVGQFAVVAPGAIVAGHVRLGHSCYIGSGATIRGALEIGEAALVGMGAVVTRNVGPGLVVVGNPARARPTTAGTGDGA